MAHDECEGASQKFRIGIRKERRDPREGGKDDDRGLNMRLERRR